MRKLLFVTLVVVLGAALGAGTAVLRIRMSPWNPNLDQSIEEIPAEASPTDGPTAKVEVDQVEYDFGTVDIERSGGEHAFKLTNIGDAPLALSEGGTSCRCALSKLEHDNILPGDSTTVTITWKPIDKPGPYEQTAKIITNDPAQPQVTLTISGRVTAMMRFSPPELVFSRLTAGETATAKSRLYYYLDTPPLEILGHQWADASTASLFEMATEPLPPEEVEDEPSAESGMLVTVTVKPGLPQGPIRQKLTLQTNATLSPSLSIKGIIGSEIAVVGPGWDQDRSILTLGTVPRQKGAKRRIILLVRGPLRKEVEFKPLSITPNMLEVHFGQRTEINKGAVIQIPLTIEIPAGSPPANHLGSKQGPLGEIILETTHPQVPTLRIFVRFAIEG